MFQTDTSVGNMDLAGIHSPFVTGRAVGRPGEPAAGSGGMGQAGNWQGRRGSHCPATSPRPLPTGQFTGYFDIRFSCLVRQWGCPKQIIMVKGGAACKKKLQSFSDHPPAMFALLPHSVASLFPNRPGRSYWECQRRRNLSLYKERFDNMELFNRGMDHCHVASVLSPCLPGLLLPPKVGLARQQRQTGMGAKGLGPCFTLGKDGSI